MDPLQSLLYGFSVCLTPTNLFYCALGVVRVGVLPGIGPLGGITLLLPTTFGMEPVSAIIMLAGIYCGAMYGGSTTSILVNIPGEAASVVTCFDGYQMARRDRKRREMLLHQAQKLMHERVMYAPIFEPATLHGVGPRVAEPAIGLNAQLYFAAPYEEMRLRKQ